MFTNRYKKWGFSTNPFQPIALHSDEVGSELLVGRGTEQKKIFNRLISNSGIVTIEGENGIGKTSLVNVVSYLMFTQSIKQKNEELYIPCESLFQLTLESDLKQFIDKVYFSIAQTLINKAKVVKRVRKQLPDTKYLDTWLNSTEIQALQGQIASFGIGESRELNTSEGFLDSGFKENIKAWLKQIFPKEENGGIICMIDNLELLNSTSKAKEILEFLRDDLISIPGTKWIFCGSNGIISTLASSTRLSGYLHKPVKIESLKSTYVTSILTQRINTFKTTDDKRPYLPIEIEDFVLLYREVNGNLREAMKKVDEYCLWVDESGKEPNFPSEKTTSFQTWMKGEKSFLYNELKNFLTTDSIKLLKEIIANEGRLNLSRIKEEEAIKFGELLPSIKQLDSTGLIALSIHERENIELSFGTLVDTIEMKSKKKNKDDTVDLVEQKNKSEDITDDDIAVEDISDFFDRDLDLSGATESDNSSNEIIKEVTITPKGRFIADLIIEK